MRSGTCNASRMPCSMPCPSTYASMDARYRACFANARKPLCAFKFSYPGHASYAAHPPSSCTGVPLTTWHMHAVPTPSSAVHARMQFHAWYNVQRQWESVDINFPDFTLHAAHTVGASCRHPALSLHRLQTSWEAPSRYAVISQELYLNRAGCMIGCTCSCDTAV